MAHKMALDAFNGTSNSFLEFPTFSQQLTTTWYTYSS